MTGKLIDEMEASIIKLEVENENLKREVKSLRQMLNSIRKKTTTGLVKKDGAVCQ